MKDYVNVKPKKKLTRDDDVMGAFFAGIAALGCVIVLSLLFVVI